MSGKQNLTKTIEGIDMFSVFARLMRTSSTNELIADGGPFTIFVPTNDAFGEVPDKIMNGWLSETKQTMLRGVLTYHIVASKLMAATLGSSTATAFSISGREMQFADSYGLKVNGCNILARNIEAANGIIHAIDNVLSPAGPALAPLTASREFGPGSRIATRAENDGSKWKLS